MNDLPFELVGRLSGPVLREYVGDFRVTIVNGPHQAGKTTLLRGLQAETGGAFVTLDDAQERAAARDDPGGYLQAMPRPLFVDEVQRAGDDFVLAIKAAVDREQGRGSFVLSGSTRFLTVPTLSESLAGRAAVLELWPFAVAERVGVRPALLDVLFADPTALLSTRPAPVTRHEYLQLCCTAAWLMEQGPDALARPGNPAAGALLETFVVDELLRRRPLAETEIGMYHLQDRDGREVDCIPETPGGRVVGIEVKASTTVWPEDFRHLVVLRDRLGSDFVAGVVFHTGDCPLPFGDRMFALPISLLWDGRPVPEVAP